MKGKISDKQRLGNYTANVGLKEFLGNSMMRFATIKQIEIIGESANYITNETKELFTDIQWKQIIGMRHVLIHEYFGVDATLVWQVIIDDIPPLNTAIQQIYILPCNKHFPHTSTTTFPFASLTK